VLVRGFITQRSNLKWLESDLQEEFRLEKEVVGE
jgi:hypothetical protein